MARASFYLDGDWDATENHFREALRLEPNSADPSYGLFLVYGGRFDEGLARIRSALERWPTNAAAQFILGQSCVCAHRYDDAAMVAADFRTQLGDNAQAALIDGMAEAGRGNYTAAITLLESQRQALLINRATTFYGTLAWAEARAGDKTRARQALKEFVALGNPMTPGLLLALGDEPGAIRAVEEAHRAHDLGLLQIRCSPEFEQLVKVPRIAQILREVRLPGLH
jgi:tetratricopeptide (TPR) repeat protein